MTTCGVINTFETSSRIAALVGEGVCRSVQPLTLAASSNAVFAGQVDATTFTFAGTESSVTQKLTGASAITSALSVRSGSLSVSSAPETVLKEAFGIIDPESLKPKWIADPEANGKRAVRYGFYFVDSIE